MTPWLIRGGHRRDGNSPCPEHCTAPCNIMIRMAMLNIIFIQVVVIAVITGLASLAIGFVLGFFLRYYFVISFVYLTSIF